MMNKMLGDILVTGSSGFIGSAVAQRLCELQYSVIGVDTHQSVRNSPTTNFKHVNGSISDQKFVENLFDNYDFHTVINLAARGNVRSTFNSPYQCLDSNVIGFLNILESCNNHQVDHLIYASSSSVYGLNSKPPFEITDDSNYPKNLYAASKKSNELMAHTYSHLYGLRTTGLRFFSVYGPWGRSDMAPMVFADNIVQRKPLKIFNDGNHKRDFTYIDDIVNAVILTVESPILEKYKIYNVGSGKSTSLLYFIELLESEFGIEAKKNLCALQDCDMIETMADILMISEDLGYSPKVSIEEGVHRFVQWYKEFKL